jgi:GH18 family chitinase
VDGYTLSNLRPTFENLIHDLSIQTYSPNFAGATSSSEKIANFARSAVRLVEGESILPVYPAPLTSQKMNQRLRARWYRYKILSLFTLQSNHPNIVSLDIDWEYPSNPTESRAYVDLLRTVRQELDRYAYQKGEPNENGRGYELTIAAPCGKTHYEKLLVGEMDRWLSFWNLMSYDYAGGFIWISIYQSEV